MNYTQPHLHDLKPRISFLQNVVSFSLRSDPERTRALHSLAKARGAHYLSSRQPGDLELSILNLTEVMFLPLPWDMRPLFLRIFYELAFLVLLRTEHYGRPDDVKCCIMCLRYLRGQVHHKVLSDSPFLITGALIGVLAIHMTSNLGDVEQDIEEIADICDELLNSDIPINRLNITIIPFTELIRPYLRVLADGQIPSKKVIDCLRKATIFLPHLHQISIALAMSLFQRLLITRLDYDHNEAMAIVDKVIHFRAPDGTPSPYRRDAMFFAVLFAKRQFESIYTPEYLEKAIYHLRICLDENPVEYQFPASFAGNLPVFEALRFNHSLVTIPITTFAMNPSFQDLSAALCEFNEDPPLMTPTSWKFFDALRHSTYKHLTNMADIQAGIDYCRQVLASYPGSLLAHYASSALSPLFHHAFECTNQIEYLDEAISATRHNMNTAADQTPTERSLLDLIHLLQDRLHISRRKEDLDELMRLYPVSAKCECVNAEIRFGFLSGWAFNARLFGHHTTSMAYGEAMSSMQASLTLTPTLDLQHYRLVSQRDTPVSVPLDYASYRIHTGQLKQSIEILERGRVLLWSEMRGLRTSVDHIRLCNPHLADKFQAVNKELEDLTTTISLDNSAASGGSSPKGIDPYGRLVLQQQKLLDDREKLISEIQAMPGFDTFLKPPSFDTLHSAASHGPVIIINHSMWRSDIIILLRHAPPSLIPTSDDFYFRAIELRDRLLEGRGMGLGSNEYEDALRSVLKELYDLVGQPVIRTLNELGVPEQSRVWWCPTSVFCSLPLHAMGPIPSEVGPPRYFLDLYIPSYTPSLSTLIDSRKPGRRTFDKPSMLLVVQPDSFMVQALEEMQSVQGVLHRPTTLMGATATPTTVLERLQNHQFVHFVCHGILEPGRPFDSSFKLYQGKSLSLIDIVRSQLPNAEFAFLAACHTAELTHESPADEALHLAAAMQYCGFRSVVGTMWAMADADGPDLARHFYGSLFSGRRKGVYYYEGTAEALRHAVARLRRKRGITLERWVNYVHYGA